VSARIDDGWLIVPCDAPAGALVEIAARERPVIANGAATRATEPDWQPAFRDWHDGRRVAKIRLPADLVGRATVRLRVAGVVTSHGRL